MIYIFYIHLFFPHFIQRISVTLRTRTDAILKAPILVLLSSDCDLHKLPFCPDAPEEGASASFHSHNSWITRQVRDAAQVSKDSNLRCLPFLGGHIPFLGLLEICVEEVYLNAPMKVSFDLFQIEPNVFDLCLSSFCSASTLAAARNQESFLSNRRSGQSMTLGHGFAFQTTSRFCGHDQIHTYNITAVP